VGKTGFDLRIIVLLMALLVAGAVGTTWAYSSGTADRLITISVGAWVTPTPSETPTETATPTETQTPTATPVRENCTFSMGFWKNHPDAWPVEAITIGGVTFSTAEGIAILQTPPRGDATYILAHQLIAAKLNIANGADPSVVADTIEAADQWLVEHPLGSDPPNPTRQQGVRLAETLAGYNEGEIGPGHCDDAADSLEILGLVSPTATPTATPSPDPAPEDSPTPTGTEFLAPTESTTPTETETPPA
jgi:hypothetical protein